MKNLFIFSFTLLCVAGVIRAAIEIHMHKHRHLNKPPNYLNSKEDSYQGNKFQALLRFTFFIVN